MAPKPTPEAPASPAAASSDSKGKCSWCNMSGPCPLGEKGKWIAAAALVAVVAAATFVVIKKK